MTNNTALQVTNFNFYGDELITLKDNATDEIYITINSVLKGIGFTDKNQIRNIPSRGSAKNDTTLYDEKDPYCISQHKLPLAKINIIPKMK